MPATSDETATQKNILTACALLLFPALEMKKLGFVGKIS